jgi:acyl CoA:acetate/3-ketoacid CoA transferase alpha subunit
MIVDPWAWVYFNAMQLFGGEYQIEGHEFQIDIMQCDAQRQCAKKSPQMGGFTEILVIRALHGLIHGRYKQGVLYLFPTADEVSDFSRSRFKTFLKNNPVVGRHVKDTDSVEVKKIGQGTLFLRGARLSQDIQGAQKTSSKLKSLPVDLLVGDEIDEMDEGALDLAKGRLDHSALQEEWYLANPTVPGFGVDALYESSDQRMWTIECEKCGRENVLELQFPDCLQRQKDGRVIRACKKCGFELDPRAGYWVAQYPSRSNDMVGWCISHLNSKWTNPKTILDEFEDPETDLVRFYNRRLARAYVSAENKLRQNDIYLCCGKDEMAHRSMGPCAMGVDVGKKLHVAIGQKVALAGVKIVKMLRANDFNDVWQIANTFNVRSAVFDMLPETHKVREFCTSAPYQAFGCFYSEKQQGVAAWNETNRSIMVNRTEICDASHRLVVTPGRLEIPRKDDEVKEFAKECCNIAKVKEEDPRTGSAVYRYRKLGDDHYRHALNYLMLACQRVETTVRAPFTGVVQKPVDFYYA